MPWGILAPDTVVSQRRQQNLGLAAAVRHFNDRAVPGIGGMWFPMPILWSVLAVSIAEELGVPALPVGNAVEARVMLEAIDGPQDRRVRGARKMQGLKDNSFNNLKRRGTYVVQPIRMAMVQPLVALGFVQGSRYGAFRIHGAGRELLELDAMKEPRRLLGAWAHGRQPHGLREVLTALSPVGTVPAAVRKLILARLLEGTDPGSVRRRNLARLGRGPTSAQLEHETALPGVASDHWSDLRAGAAFMDLRDAALTVLDRLEQHLLQLRDNNQPVRLSASEAVEVASGRLTQLRALGPAKGELIDHGHEASSRSFTAEIRNLSDARLIQKLAERDATVICWRGDSIMLGAAAGELRGSADTEDENRPPQDDAFAPQLFRLHNLHCLVTELSGQVNPGIRDAGSEAA
ncbi:hypothetical protein D2T31_01035 [Sinirhodobacter populi]|uniref:Uncharacterized protein n=1 Tax=Paenirhodobacter populi TaxID=2306993 RepID=A0A443KIJ9_9RHOB|nr:hypothetical protein [Sinirhodobacter populi]RWR32595.1 hypothetical protein D2T31_01035 [Sinirhodobacter populi]